MYQQVNFNEFHDAFKSSQYGSSYSYDGLRALFDYLTDVEDETGVDIELDVVAIASEFPQFESLAEAREESPDAEVVAKYRGGVIVAI